MTESMQSKGGKARWKGIGKRERKRIMKELAKRPRKKLSPVTKKKTIASKHAK